LYDNAKKDKTKKVVSTEVTKEDTPDGKMLKELVYEVAKRSGIKKYWQMEEMKVIFVINL
jgi:hypothetical protein